MISLVGISLLGLVRLERDARVASLIRRIRVVHGVRLSLLLLCKVVELELLLISALSPYVTPYTLLLLLLHRLLFYVHSIGLFDLWQVDWLLRLKKGQIILIVVVFIEILLSVLI